MNKIILKGIINNIEYSHSINDVDYNKATMIVPRIDGKEDIINLKFKKFSNPYNDGDQIEIQGNIRTYSQRLQDKNKVSIYVFTYFDLPEHEELNMVELDGRICKLGELRKTQSGKDVIDFIIANNLITDHQTLNCYIPCVAWGKFAKQIAKYTLGDLIHIKGQLQSREYKKKTSDNDFDIRVAHELCINEIIEEDNEV